MDRSGEAMLWAAQPGCCDPADAAPDAKYLLALCFAWFALLPVTTRPHHLARPVPASVPRAVVPVLPPLPRITDSQPALALSPNAARAFNATVPFVDGPIRPARKFVYAGAQDDRERALICLASAAWYEAGDDKAGEQAVAQVVLNRLRHPAFPKTVCGVVFEGAERKTGCQFTFTCDGALSRIPSLDAWRRARAIADRALSGFVDRRVGNATHYHTDWVVPYWSATLDKLAAVDTHIFYRWHGWWGRAAAFTARPGGVEALDPRISYLAYADPAAIGGGTLELALAKPSVQEGARSRTTAATISSTAPSRPTVLPMSPQDVRRVLPGASSAVPARPATAPATIRYSLPPEPRRRLAMSFDRPAVIADSASREQLPIIAR
jgi:hypothetical protein